MFAAFGIVFVLRIRVRTLRTHSITGILLSILATTLFLAFTLLLSKRTGRGSWRCCRSGRGASLILEHFSLVFAFAPFERRRTGRRQRAHVCCSSLRLNSRGRNVFRILGL